MTSNGGGELGLVDPFEAFAMREGGADFFEGDLITFAKGKWRRGPDKKSTGATEMFTAILPELCEGWIRFEDGRVVEREIGRIAAGYARPPRESLDDNDPRHWPTVRGESKDPWDPVVYLPMQDDAGASCCFTGGSVGALGAVAKLCRAFANAPQRAEGKLPKVLLAVEVYDHREYGEISKPVFKVVDWVLLNGQPAAPIAPVSVAPVARKGTITPAITAQRDLDDKIPF